MLPALTSSGSSSRRGCTPRSCASTAEPREPPAGRGSGTGQAMVCRGNISSGRILVQKDICALDVISSDETVTYLLPVFPFVSSPSIRALPMLLAPFRAEDFSRSTVPPAPPRSWKMLGQLHLNSSETCRIFTWRGYSREYFIIAKHRSSIRDVKFPYERTKVI